MMLVMAQPFQQHGGTVEPCQPAAACGAMSLTTCGLVGRLVWSGCLLCLPGRLQFKSVFAHFGTEAGSATDGDQVLLAA